MVAVRKVRWSTKCAGGCGTWLRAGSRAVYAYRTLWCDDCAESHKELPRLQAV